MNERSLFLASLTRVAAAFDAIGVPYVITGSMAAGFYGMPRMSADIDVLINPADADRPPIKKVLTADFRVDPDVVDDACRTRTMFQVIDPEGHVKTDIIFWRPAFNTPAVFSRAHLMEVEGTKVSVISPEDLIISKLLGARDSRSELQLRDVHGLLHEPNLDRGYVESRAKEIGVDGLLEEAEDARYGA